MDIAIIGTGGVGGYFGAKLAKAGNKVSFLARGKHLEAMQNNGLMVKSILGDFHLPQVNATSNIADIGKVDLVLIAVKAWQIVEIREDLKSLLHEHTMVLPLENGVMAARELAEVLGTQPIIGGLCRIISMIESPGVINHFGVVPAIVFGENSGAESERTKALKEVFTQAGIDSKLTTKIEAEVWKKFISICVSGLLAITKTTYGELRTIPQTRQLMIELLQEIYDLSVAMNIGIEEGFLPKTIAFIDSFPADSTSSLTRDVWEGKPSEIEYQNGTVVKLGQKYNIPTPINRFVYDCILPMELKARGLDKM